VPRLLGARLLGARLLGARPLGARLLGARLLGARLLGARLLGARLLKVKGGPCRIGGGVSQGAVPEVACVGEAQGAPAYALGPVLALLGGLQKPQVWEKHNG